MNEAIEIKLMTDGLFLEEYRNTKDWSLDWEFTFEYGRNGHQCHVHVHQGSKSSNVIFNRSSTPEIVKKAIKFLLSNESEDTIGYYPENWKRGSIYVMTLDEEDEEDEKYFSFSINKKC